MLICLTTPNLKNVYKNISRKYKNVNVLVNSPGFIHNELLIDLKSNFKPIALILGGMYLKII